MQRHTLSVTNVSKSYKGRDIVKNVSIDINSGEILGLLGPNGAGKTTCFYIILGLIAADDGQIHLDQQEITRMPVHERATLGIGYLPQEASIFRKLSVTENIMAILELRKDLDDSNRKNTLEKLLEEFNIIHIKDNTGISLSGGERRRVEIARALAFNPKFILLDEPFAGIDPISIIDIKQIINYLAKRGIGVIITDHNVRETLDICHTACILNSGKIISKGNSDKVLNDSEVRRVYLGEEFTL